MCLKRGASGLYLASMDRLSPSVQPLLPRALPGRFPTAAGVSAPAGIGC